MSGYDFVVGAGSAGCALARRLTDERDVSVLLLEAGGRDESPEIHDPPQWAVLWGDRGGLGLPDGAAEAHRLTHPLLAARQGSRRDDPQRNGLPPRSALRLRRVGARGQRWVGLGAGARFVRADGGAAPPGPPRRAQPALVHFIDACVEVGHPRNPRFSSGILDGVGWNESTIDQARRQSADAAFVTPVLDRRT